MGLLKFYRSTFMYRTRKNIMIVSVAVLYSVVIFAVGRLVQYTKDAKTIAGIRAERKELVIQITNDINLMLKKYVKENRDESKKSEANQL